MSSESEFSDEDNQLEVTIKDIIEVITKLFLSLILQLTLMSYNRVLLQVR